MRHLSEEQSTLQRRESPVYENARFHGRFTEDGVLEIGADFNSCLPEEYLGCLVFVRGYLSERLNLLQALGLYAADRMNDAKLVAHAFRRWGADLQAHVLGEYAVAVLDQHTQTLLLTHDALGLVQMFYSADGGGVSFGTHLIDLLETTPRRELDDEYIATYLARGYLTTDRTPFVSIKRLLPGMCFTWSKGAYRCVRKWNLADVTPVRLRNNGEYEEQFRSLLEAALRATVNPGGTNWVALSGGLDSSSVLSVAGKLGLTNIGAYSFISPGSPQGDEQQWARAVVDQYSVPWYTVDSAAALPFAELPDSFEFQGEPTSAVLHIKSHRLLDTLFAQHNVKTVLTGHGGDAVLGASPGTTPTYLVDLLFAGHPLSALRATRDWREKHYNKRSVSFLLRHAVFGPAIAHLQGYRFEPDLALPVPPWMEEQYAKRWRIFRLSRCQVATRDRYPGRQAIWDSVWSHALSAGGARTHVGYDVRAPLLYRPFFEFMYAVPGDQRVQPRCDRHLQRRALKGILPELVRRRGTKLFGTWAFVEGLAQSRGWLDYLCDSPQMPELGITTGPKWRDAIKQASIGNTFGDRFFISGVTLEVWLKQLAAWRPRQRSNILRSTRLQGTGEVGGVFPNARNYP